MDLEPVVSTSTARSHRRRLWGRLGVGVILIAALVIALASLALAADGFPDVPASHQYYAAINDLSSRGIILGYDSGNFGPSDAVMRQQFAKMIVLTGQYPVSEANVCPFMDVENSGPGSLYPDNYVAVCAANGITLGETETTFQPYGYITRFQVTSMLVRAANDLQADLLAAPPVGWSGNAAWAADPDHGANAAKAEYNGLLEGLDLAALSPYGNTTRGEVAQVLHNLLVKLGTSPGTTGSTTPVTTYTLAISASPAAGGGVAASPNQTTFNAGSSVMLTATPASGYTFSGWSGNASGTANPLTVTMNSNKAIVANFRASVETYTLTVSVPGGHGTVTRSPSKAAYDEGESVVLTPVPSTGYVFHHWGGDATGTAKPLTVVMNSDKAIDAFFAPAPTYTLSIILVGAGTSTVARIPAQTSYYGGQSVTLTAYPADGYVFSYWSGGHNGTSNPATVVMDSDKTIYANFRELTTYTLSTEIIGYGSISRSPNKTTFYEGESVTLTANPGVGYRFVRWWGSIASTNNPCTFTMNANKTVKVTFEHY